MSAVPQGKTNQEADSLPTQLGPDLSKLSDKEISELSKSAAFKMKKAVVNLLMSHPFFGIIASRLKIEENNSLPTAATNGLKIMYNIGFVSLLNQKEVEFLLGHEVLHCIFEHMFRVNERDHQIFNLACDFAVNQVLVDQNIGEPIKVAKPLLDSKYRGMTAEEIHSDLLNTDRSDMKTIDFHIKPSNDSNSEGESSENQKGTSGEDELEGVDEEARDKIKEIVEQAAKQVDAGDIPNEVQRALKNWKSGELDWKSILRSTLISSLRGNYSFAIPAKKTRQYGISLPSLLPEESISIAIAVDTSMSISESLLHDFLGEVSSIMSMFNSFEIIIWSFDTSVYNVKKFNEYNAHELLDYQLKGGGGTDFVVNWTYMKENNIVPNQFLMFTDGMPYGSWGDSDYCDTIFILDRGNIEPPFGEKIVIK